METLAERPTCTLPRQTPQEGTVRPLSFPQERMWPAEVLSDSGFIGCGEASPDLSDNYKVSVRGLVAAKAV